MMKYEEKTKEQLIDLIDDLNDKLNARKIGLVWDRNETTEDLIINSKIAFPLLKSVPEMDIKKGNDIENLIIEGDNYCSLSSLAACGLRVEVIYIDPPYNTGNSFRFNDKIVDELDSYKHSKWLSFMEKRLILAKQLLTEDGVIFISIDDKEACHLKLICDQVFDETNFISMLPRITKKSGKQHSDNICKNHDYLLVYANNKAESKFIGIESIDEGFKYEDEFVKTRGKYKLNQTLDYDSLYYNPGMDFPLVIDGETFVPGGSLKKHTDRHNGIHNKMDWVWRWSKAKFDFGYENGFVVIKDGNDRKRIYTKTYLNASIEKDSKKGYYVNIVKREKNISSLEFVNNKYSNDNATKDLDKILGKNTFEYSKPVELIKMLLRVLENKDVTVLDFFAGSGTTGQAVLELNEEDDGHRRFILCTNNENEICRGVCYPRISKVINGYEYSGKEITTLFEKKLNAKDFLKPLDYSEELKACIEKQKKKYDKISQTIEDSVLKVTGTNIYKEKRTGIPGNVRFFVTDTVEKSRNRDQLKYNVASACSGLLALKQGTYDLLSSTNDYSIYTNMRTNEFTCIFFEPYDEENIKPFIDDINKLHGKKYCYILAFNDYVPSGYFDGIEDCSIEAIPEKIVEIFNEIERELLK